MWLEPLQVAGTHSAIYEAYYHQVDPHGSGAVQAPDAARFLKKSRLSDVVLSKIWDLSDPNGKGYLDKTGLFVALKLVALAQAGRDISMSNIHLDTPPPKVGEVPRVPAAAPPRPSPAHPPHPLHTGHPTHVGPPAPPALSDWSIKPGERDKYNALFDSLQPSNGLIAGNKVKGVLMESKLPLDTLGKIWDLADQDKDGMLDRHEFIVAMHLVYKALEKHAVPTTLPPELRARPPSRPPSRPASRPPSRPPSPGRAPPPRPPPAASNASLLEGLLDLSSPPTSQPPPLAPLGAGVVEAGGAWVVSPADKAVFDAQFAAADADRDGLVSGLEIKHVFLESGLPQQTLAHIWALCDTEGVGKLNRGQFALAMWLVRRALRGEAPPAQLTPDMRPRPEPDQAAAPTLGPQPTPEMECIAREVDALARERRALEAEIAARERDLAATAGEADGLQSELDTLTATLKQLENQKGEAQKRLNDLKAQVEKLRSQVAAQEAAAGETEAEVAARRQAAHTLRERTALLEDEARAAQAQADALTAELRRTVLLVSQANIKLAHLEEQHGLVAAALAALGEGGAAAQAALTLRPAFDAASLRRLVGGEDEPPAEPAFGDATGSGFDADPFKDDGFARDPFAPSAASAAQDGFARDPFASGGDPFAGDAFAATDNKQPVDEAWEADPFAVLHAPSRATPAPARTSPTPSLPPKRHKTPPPRPAPPRPTPPPKLGMDFADDPFKDYRYEDPFNIDDPFAAAPAAARDPFARSGSALAFQSEGPPAPAPARSGRVSAPPLARDPFAAPAAPAAPAPPAAAAPDTWGWRDDWAAADAWPAPTPALRPPDAWGAAVSTDGTQAADAWPSDWANKNDDWTNKNDDWVNENDDRANGNAARPNGTPARATRGDDWATDWPRAARNENSNEAWPASNTLPSKKEKSPKPVKYAKSLVHTIGGIGRAKQKDKKKGKEAGAGVGAGPSEEQQWAWAAAESARLQRDAERRRQQEDAELQLVLALSRQDK